FAERSELVEDDQAWLRCVRPQAGVSELLNVLDQGAPNQRHVFRSRRCWQAEIGDTWTCQPFGKIERAVRWQQPRPENAVAQGAQPSDQARQCAAMQVVLEHRDQFVSDLDICDTASQPSEMGLVEAVAQCVERAGLT